MRTLTAFPSLFLFLLTIPACDIEQLLDPGAEECSADCVVTDVYVLEAEPGYMAQVVMTAKNRSMITTASAVWCDLKIKYGNTVLEHFTLNFGSLEPGESAVADKYVSSIQTHRDYTNLDYTLYWE